MRRSTNATDIRATSGLIFEGAFKVGLEHRFTWNVQAIRWVSAIFLM